MDKTEKLLKDLTEAHGVAGYEDPIRLILKKYLAPLGKLSMDNLGSLICEKTGSSPSPRVMLAAHMDEIGFMVKYITGEGFIKFTPLGGWFPQFLPGQRVVIKTHSGDIDGLIVTKIPFTPSDDKKRLIPIEEMFIDIGAISKEELMQSGVRIGDPIIPSSEFTILNNKKSYLAKAFDDRVGLGMMVSILQGLQNHSHPNTVFAVGTVLEEIGTLGGAITSAQVINPDVAIILEGVFSGDVEGMKPEDLNLRLGKGPSIIVNDWRLIPNLKLRDWIIETSEKIDVSIQLSTVEGFTDGAAIHLHNKGVPTVIISVPARYIHSHNGIIYRDDFDQSIELLLALLTTLDAEVAASFRF